MSRDIKGFRICDGVAATCPDCAKDVLIGYGLTPQEAQHALYETVYEPVRFWPVRADGTQSTYLVRYLETDQDIEKLPGNRAVVIAEVPGSDTWTLGFTPALNRRKLVTIHNTLNDEDVQVYLADHVVSQGDEDRINVIMNQHGHQYGINDIFPICDDIEEYDEDLPDEPLKCAFCEKEILPALSKRDQ